MSATLELRNLTKRFGSGRLEVDALTDVSMAVDPGELVAVMGPSGSGKTTLMSLAGGLDHPTSGSVRVEDADLATLGTQGLARLRRRRIGFVFQQLNLIDGLTALENVSLPLELDGSSKAASRAAAAEALALVGMDELGNRFPDELSGGEQQRVAIARAAVGERILLLADEPTGALDSVTGEAVLRLLRAHCDRGGSGVLVTHGSLDIAPFANELAFVGQQYLDFYGRPIPSADATWLIAALRNGSATATGEINNVLKSDESEGRGIVAIARLYYAAFDRQPDKGALYSLNRDVPLTAVANDFLSSSEGKATLPTDPTAFVRKLYTNALNRQASASEVSFWADQVRSKGRASVLVSISQSTEHKRIRRGMAPLQATYLAMLHRPADSGAYGHWLPILNENPAATPYLIETIRKSAEYRRLNG